MKYTLCFYAIITAMISAPVITDAQVTTGGSFTLSQSVIAGGGAESVGGQFKIEGTTGQPAAGAKGIAGGFTMQNGFWVGEPLSPTAARVTVSGRVLTPSANRLTGAYVSLADVSDGSEAIVLADVRGYFTFENVEVGKFYIVSVRRKGFTFDPSSIGINLIDAVDDLIFNGSAQPEL